ncbi:MAG: metallopeptidase TldD-related protein, partial [Nannocystaceae bacterium]
AKPGGGTKIGATIAHPSITLRSDPADPRGPSRPFDGDGQPIGATTWIDRGVLRALECSRYWAQKQGATPVPTPGNFILEGTDAAPEELLRGIDRGVLVTRFWYNRIVEPRTILATGLTRDGTFLIEQGKVVKAVKNMRYNESPVTMLGSVLAIGRAERVPIGGRVMVVPPLVVGGFNFSSLSDAV